MSLPEIALRRSVFAAVISILIVLVGLMALTRIPAREMPDIAEARMTVSVDWTGAAPDVVDSQVATVIEGALAGVAGLRTMETESERGGSRTVLIFDSGVDMDAAAQDVRAAVDGAERNLPEETDPPRVRKNDTQGDPVARMSLRSDRMSPTELSDYAERVITDRFARLTGVASVNIYGERAPAMRIWLDPSRMAAHGIAASDIIAALRENNVELPAGELETDARQLQVLARTRLETAGEFARMTVMSGGARPVALGDVATVARGAASEDMHFRSDFDTALGMGVLAQSQANALTVSAAVKQEIAAIAEILPEGTRLTLDSDEAAFVEASIDAVARVFTEAVLLVIGVIVLFLGSVRAAIPPAVTIPISLLGACAGIWIAGFTLNTLTLFALVLAIGLVVDDAIVVLENIQRRMRMGEPRLVAALRGGIQVNFAVIATTAVLIAVFLPISFLPGDVGKLFTEFGATLAIAVSVSAFVALTLTPALSALVLQEGATPGLFERISSGATDALSRGYRAVLRRALDRPMLVLALSAFISAGSVALYERLPSTLTPREDRGMMIVNITAPQGSNLARTDAVAREAEALVRPWMERGVVENVTTIVGAWGELRRARMFVRLVHWDEREMTADQLAAELRGPLSDLGGAAVSLRMPGGFGGSGGGLEAWIGGPDGPTAAQWGAELVAAIEEDPRIASARVDWGENQPGAAISIDRDRAEDLGVAVADAAEALQTFFASRAVTEFRDRGRMRDVVLQAGPEDRDEIEDLSNILVRAAGGELIPVSAFASVRPEASAPALTRFDRAPSAPLEADLAGGASLGEAIAAVEAIAAEVLPPEASIAWDGAAREYLDSNEGVAMVFALALAVVFLALAAQFESFVHPMTIMLSAPLAVTGALGTLWWFDQTVNVYAQVGLVLLIGLTAKNGVLIVEFCNQMREGGASVREAALEGATSRLRPVLMTTIATVLGALPLATAEGAGAEARSSIGLVIVGGVSFASALTLFLTPVLYEAFARYARPVAGRNALIDRAMEERPQV